MTTIEKLERALALAKELQFNDTQAQELFALVLNIPITRISFTSPSIDLTPKTPVVPWNPYIPLPPNDTIIWNCNGGFMPFNINLESQNHTPSGVTYTYTCTR